MKNRDQRSEIRGQRSKAGGQRSVSLSAARRPPFSKRGFTLIEVLLATSISIMVFFAMGSVLVKSFALWKDATAHWRLAQVSRIARERILCGAFSDPSGGLLAASNVSIVASTYALNVGYQAGTNFYGVCAYTNIYQPRMYLIDQQDITPFWIGDCDQWSWAIRVGNSGGVPDVEVDSMTAVTTNDLVIITYRLSLSAAGKTNYLPHTIRACLVNKED
ncbi:MAG: prepilin-type N-terminal cleavage/methylation domain-containing protein [Pontiellaceae bacterium]|jgi:prepilin-type N-terminal cleavage/methylation domain-containing protein|nr:prepilin-type N-terminal cleavage/methylation domain-containing protein [Pontiellaceae bacterium]